MDAAQLKAYMAERAALIERELLAWLPAVNEAPFELHKAMRYTTLGKGKRLRPILALAAAEAVGGDPRRAMPAAVAIELIHNYSLIHDDLPCMDDDERRRGLPTCHIVFGEADALLAGDALLTLAFEVLAASAIKAAPADAPLFARVGAEMARAAGSRGMVGGQVLDLETVERRVGPGGLRAVHARKTGALFVAAARGGAILAGGEAEDLAALTTYAENFGLAFQTTDDILDWPSTRAEQRLIGAATFPALLGVEGSRELVRQAVTEAKAALARFADKGETLAMLADLVAARSS